MSRAFVKEQDGPSADDVPDRPLGQHPAYVTPTALTRLKHDLAAALERRRELSAREDIETQSALAALTRELRWLEAKVASAIPIDPSRQPRDRVAFGATVTVTDDAGIEHRYRIVGEDEAGQNRQWVSYHSPLAKALLGAHVGDEVTWHRPAGDVTLEVLAIGYENDDDSSS